MILDVSHPLTGASGSRPCAPSKIVAVGLNYRTHAAEVKMELPEEPILFLKPSTAVIGPEETIIYPAMSKRVDYEGRARGGDRKALPGWLPLSRLQTISSAIPALMMSLPATCRKKTGSGPAPRALTPLRRWGLSLKQSLTRRTCSLKHFSNGEIKQSASTRDLIFPVNLPGLVYFAGHDPAARRCDCHRHA